MRHTFHFGRSPSHRAYLLTRSEAQIVEYRFGFVTSMKLIWFALKRSVVRPKQQRRPRERAQNAPPPQVPVILSEKWD